MLWLIFAVLTAIAVMGVLWPLAKAPRGRARANLISPSIRLSSPKSAGRSRRALVTPEDAQAAKAEAARRLMGVAESGSRTLAGDIRNQGQACRRRRPYLCPGSRARSLYDDRPSGIAGCAACRPTRNSARAHGFCRCHRQDRGASWRNILMTGAVMRFWRRFICGWARPRRPCAPHAPHCACSGETPERLDSLWGGLGECRPWRRDGGSQAIFRSRR